MAIEPIRGCGYRKIGGLYLMGSGLHHPCDRLPLEIGVCPVCGEGLQVTRAPKEINAYKLWGNHYIPYPVENDAVAPMERLCGCSPCVVCRPPDGTSYLMGVGRDYTPQSFVQEALTMGICKRIAQVPKNLKLGETVIYLAHRKAIYAGKEDGKDVYKPAVFYAFVPQKVEKLIWQSEASPGNLEALDKRGITPVLIPDGDADHK